MTNPRLFRIFTALSWIVSASDEELSFDYNTTIPKIARKMNPLVMLAISAAASGCSFLLDFDQPLAKSDAGTVIRDADNTADGQRLTTPDGCIPRDWFRDKDEDGFGTSTDVRPGCERPDGFVAQAGDCDDDDRNRNPQVAETCNGIDDNCDGIEDPARCEAGCADGEREGFVDVAASPDIAGCAGGFSEPGILVEEPECDREGGDDGANPRGTDCTALDLCAEGWHVCVSSLEVNALRGNAPCVPDDAPSLFFATGQSGPGAGVCGIGVNDIFGCGNLGAIPLEPCEPLNRFSGDLCGDLGAPWACGADRVAELLHVQKPGPGGGGVLCCRGANPP